MTSCPPRSRGYPEDLSIQGRRGCLSAAERQLLERTLAAHPMLAAAHQVGSDFDQISTVRAGDDDLVARAIDALRRPGRPSASTRRVRRMVGVWLAAAFVAGGVAAATGGVAYRAYVPTPRPTANPVIESAARNHPLRAAPGREHRAAQASATTAPVASVVAISSRAATARTVPSGDAEPTAAGLFEQASAARRGGDLARASALFTELEQRFPRSQEAHLGQLSLGKLLLTNGRPGPALTHFRRYLNLGGPLAEEALVGSAESLLELGQAGAERRAWQELLEKYPTSVHAARAKKRLQQIDDAAP